MDALTSVQDDDLFRRCKNGLGRSLCDTGAQNPVACRFLLFYLIIFYIAAASKYFLQYQNVLF